MYLNYIKDSYRILPQRYKKKVIPFLSLSLVNLLLELFSLAIVVPLVLVIVNKDMFISSFFENYLPDLAIGQNSLLIVIIIVLLVVIFILKNSLSIKIINYQTKTCFKIAAELSGLCIQNYLYYDFIEFKKQARSEIIRNSLEVPNEFVVYVLISLNTILTELILLGFIFFAGVLINMVLTLWLFVIFLIAVVLAQAIDRKKLKRINDHLASYYSANVSNLLNLIHGFFEIRSAGREQYFLKKFDHSNQRINQNYATLFSRNLITPKYIEVIIIAIIGSIIILYNYMPPGASGVVYISFLAAAAMKVIPSVNKIITSLVNFKSHVFTIDLIKEKAPQESVQHEQESKPVTFSQGLQVNNMSFSYNDKPLLEDIYLTINKGDIITIVGKSGAGKSTLLHIITQLLKPQQGYVSIDGHKINTDDSGGLPGIFAYIPQDPFILEGSILDNITLGKNDYDTNVLKDLLADFYMESVIDNLPQKWDTFIGNNGHQLSGGQKQRIALVRALLQQPQILILDEATNQLESELEIKVLNRLKEMVKNKNSTLLLVSHHVKNIKTISDHIYKLSANGLEKLTEE